MANNTRTVWTFWCEWDIGINDAIYSTKERALAAVSDAFELQGITEEYTVREALDAGLLTFTEHHVE